VYLPTVPLSKGLAEPLLSYSELALVILGVIVIIGLLGEYKISRREETMVPKHIEYPQSRGRKGKPRKTFPWLWFWVWVVIVGIIGEGLSDALIWDSSDSLQVIADNELKLAELHAAGRRLLPGSEEQKDVIEAMKPFAGMPVRIISYDDDQEARTFTVELMRTLHAAKLVTPFRFERVSADDIPLVLHGIVIAGAPDKPSSDADATLLNVLNDLHFCEAMPTEIGFPNIFGEIAPKSILIFVGYKQTGGRNCK